MIRIYGHSDDCLEVEGYFRGNSEYSSYSKPITIIVSDFVHNTGVIVTGEYGKHSGVWSIAVEPIDENKPMPDMRIVMAGNGYSPMLMIQCDENTQVRELEGGELWVTGHC